MTASTLPPAPEVPESTVNELHALYREAARDEPAPSLDRLILDAARAELKADQATQSRRPAAWWKGWLPVTSAIAVALVGLSVTWRVMDQQERHLREESSAARVAGENAAKAAVAEAGVAAGSASNAPAPAVQAPEPVPPAEALATRAASASAPVAPAAEAAKTGKRAEPEVVSKTRDLSLAEQAASGSGGPAGKTEARSFGASSDRGAPVFAEPSLAPPAGDIAIIHPWLRQIRELRAAGRHAEAARSLARLRERYPDLVLPDDLQKMN